MAEKSALVNSICKSLDRVGRISGDDLLDVSAYQFQPDNSYWIQRFVTRTIRGFDRHEVIRQLTDLMNQTVELTHYLVDSKYLQIREGWPPHQLELERMTKEMQKLQQLHDSMENFQRGIRAQEQHYRKVPDEDVADKFQAINSGIEDSLQWLEPILAKLQSQIHHFQCKIDSSSTASTTAAVTAAIAAAASSSSSSSTAASPKSLLFRSSTAASPTPTGK